MYITAILPYVVLGIFLIRGLTLKGAISGIEFLFVPDVCFKIIRKAVLYMVASCFTCNYCRWLNWPTQLPGWMLVLRSSTPLDWHGGGLSLSQATILFSKRHSDVASLWWYDWNLLLVLFTHKSILHLFFCSNNCVKDAIILSVVTGFTSIYAATVTYSIIGFRATEKYENCISKWVKCRWFKGLLRHS